MGNNIRSSRRVLKALAGLDSYAPPLADAMDAVHLSVDRFRLLQPGDLSLKSTRI